MMFEVTWLNYETKGGEQGEGEEGKGRTMASGNWRSMKSEMEGKILSEVSGASEVSAAVAKELNATSTGDGSR